MKREKPRYGIEMSSFQHTEEMNEWIGDGRDVEILNIHYWDSQNRHILYYRLKPSKPLIIKWLYDLIFYLKKYI